MKKLSLSELGYGCYEFDSRRIRLHYFVSEIERKSGPFLNDVFGTLNSTWATSLFFKFAKIETKESFVTRTNALLAGTLIYNR